MDDMSRHKEEATLSVKQAAQAMNVSDKTIRRWIHEGQLVAIQVMGPYELAWRIPTSAVTTAQHVIDVLPVERSVDPHTLGRIIAQAVAESHQELTHAMTQQIHELNDQVSRLTQILEEQQRIATKARPETAENTSHTRTDAELMAEIRATIRSTLAESKTPRVPHNWWPWTKR